MLYDYLNEFATIVRSGSLSAASKELGVSQPALGRHLTMLEQDLGASLVIRSAQGIRPTAEGRYLLGMALDIQSIGEEIDRHFHSSSPSSVPRQLYVAGLTSTRGVSEALAEGCRRAAGRGAEVTVRYRPDENVASPDKVLLSEKADVIITLGVALERHRLRGRFYCTKLCEAACLAVVEPENRLSHQVALSLDDLATMRVARCSGNYDNSDLHWEELRRRCIERGFSPISHTVSFDAVPHEWDLPDCVVLFRDGRLSDGQLADKQKVVLPVRDFSYEVYGVCRTGDATACRLLDDAAAWLAERPTANGAGSEAPTA